MMQVKKYRAATTREALEQIKNDLGENAFVLETKQVRTRGFLGLSSEMQIEISAAAPQTFERNEAKTPQSAPSAAAKRILNLTDDAPAVPQIELRQPETTTDSQQPEIALAFDRIEAAPFAERIVEPQTEAQIVEHYRTPEQTPEQTAEKTPEQTPEKFAENSFENSAQIGVEISLDAPRVVYQKTAAANDSPSETAAPVSFAAPDVQTAQTAAAAIVAHEIRQFAPILQAAPILPEAAPRALSIPTVAEAELDFSIETETVSPVQIELERLRAEIREMKFSLGAFAARQTAVNPHAAQVEAPAELYNSPYYETYTQFLATGLAAETARDIIADATSENLAAANPHDLAQVCLLKSLPSLVRFAEDPLARRDEQTIMAVIGATGAGKTTTIAKLAARAALREQRRVELVTLDTFRIAAVEQLKTFAEIINVNLHIARSTLELAAILRRLPQDAVVLIDTIGKSPHDLADQLSLADFLREREDIFKLALLPAATDPSDALFAIKKYQVYAANCLAITKLDETMRPGAIVNVVAETKLPLVYLSAGQRVPEDLQTATAKTLAAQILREPALTI